MLNIIYQDIEEKLFLELNENYTGDFAKLKHVDIWNNQIDEYERELPFDMPAIFVELQVSNLVTKGGRWAQHGTLQVTLHVVQYELDSKEKKSKLLSYLDEVNKVVHGLQGERFNHLLRTDIRLSPSAPQIVKHEIVYVANCWDYEAVQTKDFTQVTIPGMQVNKK